MRPPDDYIRQVTFSEAVQGVDGATFTLRTGAAPNVAADVTGAGDTWTLNPRDSLQENTQYTAQLTGGLAAIRDAAGNALADASWSFRTRGDTTAPAVTDRSPASGATGVPVAGVVHVTFSEEVVGVDQATFLLERASTGAEVPAAVLQRATNRWTLIPAENLRQEIRYTVVLLGGPGQVRDLAGNALADTEWSFTTAGGEEEPGDDVRRPRVVNESPRDGATGVSRFTDVRAHFSEAVRGVNTRTFRITTRRGAVVGADVFRTRRSNRWVLDPERRLARGTRYFAVLRGAGTGIEDAAGNSLATTRWSFRTSR